MKILFVSLILASSAFAKDGRYQLVPTDGTMSGALMIDTQTGNIWQNKCIRWKEDKTCVGFAWDKNHVIDVNIKYPELMKLYKEE